MIRDKIVSESLINVKKEENEEKEGLPYNNIEKGYNFNPEEKHQRKNKCHYNEGVLSCIQIHYGLVLNNCVPSKLTGDA